MRPERILMTADCVGGVWTYSLDLARALCARGVEVIIAAMGAEPTTDQLAAARAIDGLTLDARPYRLEWMADCWSDLDAAGRWLIALERRHRPDLVHLNTFVHGALPWRAPLLMVGHSCVLSWHQAVRGERAGVAWARYAVAVRHGLRAAQMVVAPSLAMLDALERHYGPLPASRVIWNGCDADVFAPGPKQELVFSAGRLWDEAKNLDALLRAAPRVRWPVHVAGERRHPEARGAGDGSGGSMGDGSGGDNGGRGVTLLGSLPRRALAERYARAAIYALPMRYEPFGLTVLEAALAGCALVVGDIESQRELWSDAAVFVPPGDPDAIADAINALADDPARRVALAGHARRRALRLSVDRMVERYLAVYARLLGASSAAPFRAPVAAPIDPQRMPCVS